MDDEVAVDMVYNIQQAWLKKQYQLYPNLDAPPRYGKEMPVDEQSFSTMHGHTIIAKYFELLGKIMYYWERLDETHIDK